MFEKVDEGSEKNWIMVETHFSYVLNGELRWGMRSRVPRVTHVSEAVNVIKSGRRK
jgi:hypothetical protein